MDSKQVREKFLNFFKEREHTIVPSSSLVPQNDPSVLFTTAGMQQFKPYYVGTRDSKSDFGSLNTVSVQKCVRTNDIDEVGDETHLTFFEMLGNFSFGGYWKEEAIKYAHEFITKELGLEIDYVSIFSDDESGIPADLDSRKIWQSIDPKLKIKEHKKEDNFWGPTGEEGPCGPTTEIYINGVEIWNIVFNEFYKTREGKYEPLKTKGIDTGMGLERLLVQVQNKKNVFETDLFNGEETKEDRVVADHVKASSFIISDGVRPSKNLAGSVLRRLMRDIFVGKNKNLDIRPIVKRVIEIYSNFYKNLNEAQIIEEFEKEKSTYLESLKNTRIELLQWQKKDGGTLTGYQVSGISSTLGARPLDVLEVATELNLNISPNINMEISEAFKKHQEVSRAGAEQKFKGGLSGTGEMETKYHTATHLLHQALRDVLGPSVSQKGSNVTSERLRFDFAFERKMTEDEKKRVEDTVNEKIKMKLPVYKVVMKKEEAEKTGALHFFGDKYGEEVNVYYIGDSLEDAYSKEFCGGPHVENIGDLGKFKIQKEEAVSAGVRRIKAVLE
jgi:alanyl-tRNA synthetase